MGVGRVLMSRCSSRRLFVGGGGGGQLIINSKNFGASAVAVAVAVAVGFQSRIFYSSGASDAPNPPPNPKAEWRTLRVKRLSEAAVLPSATPTYYTYNIASARNTKVPAGGKAIVPTDLSVAIPRGQCGLITQLRDVNQPPLDAAALFIDPSYRGPIDVILFNHFGVDLEVKVGDVIASLFIYSVVRPEHLQVVEDNSLEPRHKSAGKDFLSMADQTNPKLSNERSSCLRVKRLSEKAIMPSGASASSVGYHLFSARDTKVPARDKALVPTDLRIAVEKHEYELSAHILPHSDTLAQQHAIDVGHLIIDYYYRGRVYVHLFNHSDVDYHVKVGDTIAQLLVVARKGGCPDVVEVED